MYQPSIAKVISNLVGGLRRNAEIRKKCHQSGGRGTLRRDCLDHVLIFGEQHLRRVLTLYSLYYNETRTHLGLSKDAPLRRAVQRTGCIVTIPILSGLHHRYARI